MQLLLLLATVPLILGACPRILAGLDQQVSWSDSQIGDIKPLVDVACGRKAFALEFWVAMIIDKVMKYVAVEQIMRQPPSFCTAECIENTDKKYHIRAFTPLLNSVREAVNEIDNAEAAAYALQIYNFSIAFEFNTADWNNGRPQYILGEFRRLPDAVSFPKLSTEAEAAIFRAVKRGFGIEDTTESRYSAVSTAMKALETAEYPKDASDVVAQIENTLQLLEDSHSFGKFALSICTYSYNVEYRPKKWKKFEEILPAAEILFMQYVTLKNEEAKAFIESFLTSLKEHYQNAGSSSDWQLANRKLEQTALDGLSTDALSALESTFPELFAYLYKNDYIVNEKNLGIF